jgi:hypothetical protein
MVHNDVEFRRQVARERAVELAREHRRVAPPRREGGHVGEYDAVVRAPARHAPAYRAR